MIPSGRPNLDAVSRVGTGKPATWAGIRIRDCLSGQKTAQSGPIVRKAQTPATARPEYKNVTELRERLHKRLTAITRGE